MPTFAATDDYDTLYKLILVGDPNVGKTRLLSRYTNNAVAETPGPTLGAELAVHTVPLLRGGTVKAQIWDTAGQERFKAITYSHFRRANGAIIVYNVMRRQSFINASKWQSDVIQQAGKGVVMCLVGNQVDLADGNASERQVTFEEAAAWAEKHSMIFLETSAVTNYNVKKVFELLMQEIYDRAHKVVCDTGSRSPPDGWRAPAKLAAVAKAGAKDQVFTLNDVVGTEETSSSCC